MSWSQLSKLLVSTLGSRVLGLVRDSIFGAVLGAGLIQDAFVTAFTLPNLLRRLLGEGALTSALIPMLAQEQTHGGTEAAQKLLNQVLSRLLVTLSAVCLVLTAVCIVIGWDPAPAHGKEIVLTGRYGAVMMPYLVLVCLAAAVSAALNHLRLFTAPALSQVWMNVVQIGSIGLMWWLCRDDHEAGVYLVCLGVLVGGLLQLAVPVWALLRAAWSLSWDWSRSPGLRRLLKLLIPGLVGAGVFQINTAFSRFYCIGLEEGAATILYNVNRFTELPLGLFAVSVTTLVFPALALAASKNDLPDFSAQFHRGLRLILAVTVPAAAGLWALREPIVRLVYGWHNYDEAAVIKTITVMGLFSFGIPLFALGTFASRAFHARQDMATPLKAAVINLCLNAILCLTLGHFWGLPGLAIAILLAYGSHALGLSLTLWRKLPEMRAHAVLKPMTQIALASVAMAGLCFGGWELTDRFLGHGKVVCLVSLGLLIPLGAGLYFATMHLLHFAELRELTGAVLKRFKR